MLISYKTTLVAYNTTNENSNNDSFTYCNMSKGCGEIPQEFLTEIRETLIKILFHMIYYTNTQLYK